MRLVQRLILGGSLALTLLIPPSVEARRGGEDFPFFCRLREETGNVTSFRVTPSLRSPTGYVMTLYTRLRFTASVPVSLKESLDGKYLVLEARQRHLWLLWDRVVLAYIGKDERESSHVDVQVKWTGSDSDEWDLKPMRCFVR